MVEFSCRILNCQYPVLVALLLGSFRLYFFVVLAGLMTLTMIPVLDAIRELLHLLDIDSRLIMTKQKCNLSSLTTPIE